METKSLIIERTYNASIEKVWKAITDKDQMKEWYFEIEEFKPEKGFEFRFYGGHDDRRYLHICEVIEVSPPEKLSYSWRYDGYPGKSVVTFELFKEAEKQTRVRLTHESIQTFPADQPDFSASNFTEGWNFILGDSLRNFVEADTIIKSVSILAPSDIIWDIVLNPNNQWGKAFGEGAFADTDWKKGSQVIWTDADGDIGAKGIVVKHENQSSLEVNMYDDVNAMPGDHPGEYFEKYHLSGDRQTHVLTIEAGPLSRKYIDMHAGMWDRAAEIIKELAEKRAGE